MSKHKTAPVETAEPVESAPVEAVVETTTTAPATAAAPVAEKKPLKAVEKYSLTEAGLEKFKNSKGQPAIIVEAMKQHQPISTADLAKLVEFPNSVQPASRVVGYYFVGWKKNGYIAVAEPAETSEAA